MEACRVAHSTPLCCNTGENAGISFQTAAACCCHIEHQGRNLCASFLGTKRTPRSHPPSWGTSTGVGDMWRTAARAGFRPLPPQLEGLGPILAGLFQVQNHRNAPSKASGGPFSPRFLQLLSTKLYILSQCPRHLVLGSGRCPAHLRHLMDLYWPSLGHFWAPNPRNQRGEGHGSSTVHLSTLQPTGFVLGP